MKNRYTSLDISRALALISMIVFHTVWDLVYIFRIDMPWFKSDIGEIWQQSILWTFVLLSGFCSSLGKKRLKRAVTVIICSVIISVVTLIFMPSNFILFGVLCFLGTAMLVMIPLDKVFSKIPPPAGIILSAILFALTKNLMKGKIAFGEFTLLRIPDFLYANDLTAFLGFPPANFSSSDYVPFFPWIFLFFCGYFLFRLFLRKDLLKHFSFVSCKPLEFIGRNTLWIYMIHQPVIYGILYLIFRN